ncbi:cell division protein HetF [Calothrix sp. CCY 0018]|uniref:cell division protein HetF n=1 Tax=Calothrix sp. CCY 0018 TaxID=3103864 RepID=UPI0039C6B4C8
MTQEFHISVTPVGQNDYLVRTEQVAPGVPLAEELVRWPVADWLAAAGSLMNDPLQSVLQGDAMALSACLEETSARNSVNLVALGQQLYNALFQGTLRDSWITAQGIAQNHQQVLRLRLGLKDTKLARLPWEVMHQGDRPIATGPYIAFSRYQSGMSGTSRMPVRNIPQLSNESGIKVLMVIASPADQVRLNLLKQEAIRLQAELERKIQGGDHLPEIELSVLEQPGREELTQALEQGNYHVLHYSGHSNFGANGGEIYLVSARTGLTETLYGDDLAGLLVNNNIQMAVFNSCLGTYAATSDSNLDTGQRNLTETLVKRGIKSVLAMSERIPDEVALTLTQLFYRNLSQGYAVDLSVSRMRQGLISTYGSHQLYWALPILYLQPEFDGYLDPEIYLPQSGELFNDYDPSSNAISPLYTSTSPSNSDMLPMGGAVSAYETEHSSDSDLLGEDMWGDLVDEIEYDDASYPEDSAIVSDIFRQIDDEKSLTEAPMHAELVGQLEDDYEQKQLSPDINYQSEDTLIWDESEYPLPINSQESVVTNESPSQESFTSYSRQSSQVTTKSAKAAAKKQKQNQRLALLGVLGISAIAFVGGIDYWRTQQNPSTPQQIVQKQSSSIESVPTEALTAQASGQLTQGKIKQGLKAVEELLNRGALSNAETALENVDKEQINNPYVNFVKGRLAWQFIQKGDTKYSIDDARRYWEVATQNDPDSFLYKNALGFAYYAEGEIDRANDSWLQALDLSSKKNAAQNVSNSNNLMSVSQVVDKEALTAYAGLALGLYQSSQNLSSDKKVKYISEAVKFHRKVMKDDAKSFQRNSLAQNWLWTEKAIGDWQSLLKLDSGS